MEKLDSWEGRMRLLVAEDDGQVAHFVVKGLREAGFSVDRAADGPEALHMARSVDYDAVIMDIMMPGLDGFEVVQRMRSQGLGMPVIYLTARDSVDDVVRGLEEGGDDYLKKPFSIAELLARIRALLRRGAQGGTGRILEAGDMTMDLLSRKVRRGERTLDLTAKEFELLEYFMRHSGHVLTRTMIAEHVWDIRFDFDSNLIEVHLARLRKKMESGGEPRLIRTVKGVGYVFRP